MKTKGCLGVGWLAVLGFVLTLSWAVPGPVAAQTVGMVVNHDYREVYVFDADTDTVLAILPIPVVAGELGGLFDCVVTQNKLGYISDFNGRKVWVVDLANPALPAVAGHIDVPIEVEDLALSADQKYLFASDSGLSRPLMTIDLATRTVVSQMPGSYQSVEACTDGTVLASQYIPGNWYYEGAVIEFGLAGNGTLAPQGEPQPMRTAINSACDPRAQTGVAVTHAVQEVYVLGLPGIMPGSYQPLASPGIAAVFSPLRNAVFVRSENFVQKFAYDPVTEVLQAPSLTSSVQYTKPTLGVDKMAMHPLGTKLYIPEDTMGMSVWDAGTGNYYGHIDLTSSTPQKTGRLAGVCLPELLRMAIDIKPGKDVNVIDPMSTTGVQVAIFGTAGHSGADIVASSVTFAAHVPPIGKPLVKDLNSDGVQDMRVNFRGVDFGVAPGDTTACLTGQFRDGLTFVGCDSVSVP